LATLVHADLGRSTLRGFKWSRSAFFVRILRDSSPWHAACIAPGLPSAGISEGNTGAKASDPAGGFTSRVAVVPVFFVARNVQFLRDQSN